MLDPSAIYAVCHCRSITTSPFTMMVSEGQQVNAGDALVDVDWNVVKSAGKPTDVIVVFTNPAKIDKLSITAKGAVATGAPIGTIVTK